MKSFGSFSNRIGVLATTKTGRFQGASHKPTFRHAAVLMICCLMPLAKQATASVTFITSCPYTITQPGNYHLANDLLCSNKLSVNANHVDLHMNGHTLTCTDAVFPGVEVNGTDVSITGVGTITGCGNPVFLRGGDTRVVGMIIISCRSGITVASDGNTLLANIAIRMQLNGILIAGSDNIVRSNLAEQNGLSGIAVTSGGENLVQSNLAQHNGSFDVADANAACGSDQWKRNIFGTASQPCLR